jgi:NAD(P)-dependent dehydrogenase (short-subunit alcohol dehydrogenase family)
MPWFVRTRWWVVPAAVGARRALRRRTPFVWRGRVVLVVGASRGLGLGIARELVGRGAAVVVAARDAERLGEVAAELRAAGGDALAVEADIGDPRQARTLVDRAVEWKGRLDALVNVAGVIQVASVDDLSIADFEEAIDVMALGPIACTLAALPALRRSDAGRIATITSIGGKVPVPRLLPYAVAKHAAVGFSESLRAELGPGPLKVTTVVPGFMRTGSHVHARFKGPKARQYRWFATFSQLPGVSMAAEDAVRAIVAGIARGDAVVSTTWWAPVAARVHGLLPGLGSRTAALVSPLLPGDAQDDPGPRPPAEPDLEEAVPGHQIDAGIGPLERRARRAISAFRQRPRGKDS